MPPEFITSPLTPATGITGVRVPPQNIDSERALLGAIMLRPDALYEVIDIISPQAFYAEKHRIIFDAMLDLLRKQEPIDMLSLTSRLKETKNLDRVGGGSYVAELATTVPTAANVRHYATLVARKFFLRRLIEASAFCAELGYSEAEDVETLLDQAEKKIFEVTNLSHTQTYVELRDILGEAWDRLDKLHNSKGELRGIPTGFAELDMKLAGLQKSDLIILAARPSMGKTSLALDIARQAATAPTPTTVGIFSLEMSSQQLVDRILAAASKVDAWRLRTGRLSLESEFDQIRDGLDRLSKAPIFIDDQPGNNILKMRAVARRLKSEKNLGLIIVDYLQLMVPAQARASDSLVQQVTEISRALKGLARELDIPVLALSQLSRAVESRGGRPRLSDLRDSGCLAGDTIIVDAQTGKPHSIKDLAEQGTHMSVFSLTDMFTLEKHTAVRFFPSGRKQIFTLTTRSGRTIGASANHPFRTLSGWKRLDEISPGDHIAVPRVLANERVKNIPEYVDFLQKTKPNTNVDIVPREAWRLIISPAREERGMSWRDLADGRDRAYNGSALMRAGISRNRIAAIGALLASPECLELATSDVLWDKIVSVKPGPIENVYDATVPGLHNFVANDIVVHNSIEQDADVVMFIHREDKYKDNSEKPNIAEILIEKHRNGPTGKIELYFDDKKSSFVSIEKSDFGDIASPGENGGF